MAEELEQQAPPDAPAPQAPADQPDPPAPVDHGDLEQDAKDYAAAGQAQNSSSDSASNGVGFDFEGQSHADYDGPGEKEISLLKEIIDDRLAAFKTELVSEIVGAMSSVHTKLDKVEAAATAAFNKLRHL